LAHRTAPVQKLPIKLGRQQLSVVFILGKPTLEKVVITGTGEYCNRNIIVAHYSNSIQGNDDIGCLDEVSQFMSQVKEGFKTQKRDVTVITGLLCGKDKDVEMVLD
jgi:hypothetical protein